MNLKSYARYFILIVVFEFAIYSMANAQWTTATLSQGKRFFASTSVGTKVLFAGGEARIDNFTGSISDVVDIYDNSTNTWSTATLSQARDRLCAASVGSKAFFAGGLPSSGGYSNLVDIYDYNTNLWTTATLSQARSDLSAASIGSKVFFAGGQNFSGSSNVVDVYDDETNLWTTATLSQGRMFLAATSVGTKVLFAGGNSNSGDSNVVDIYDNSTGIWSVATLSLARQLLKAASVGSKAFFAGGSYDGSSPFIDADVVDIYDNNTNTWNTAMLSVARTDLAASSVRSKVLFAGGRTNSTGLSNVVDIYDNSTNTWTTAALSQARSQFTGTSVGTKVFFAGGSIGPNQSISSNVVDIFNDNPDVDETAPQLITFGSIENKTYGDLPFSLSATTDSGLPIIYTSSDLNVASVSGNIVTINSAGTAVITAAQAGNNSYSPAQPVPQTLIIAKATLTATVDNKSRLYGEANPTFTTSYTGFKNGETSSVIDTAPTTTTTATLTSNVGTYNIIAGGGVDNNYSFTYINGTLTITKETLTGLYPNPTTQFIKVVLTPEQAGLIEKLELYTIDGKRIDQLNSLSGKEEILLDVSYYNSGAYIIKMQFKNGLSVLRFVKI